MNYHGVTFTESRGPASDGSLEDVKAAVAAAVTSVFPNGLPVKAPVTGHGSTDNAIRQKAAEIAQIPNDQLADRELSECYARDEDGHVVHQFDGRYGNLRAVLVSNIYSAERRKRGLGDFIDEMVERGVFRVVPSDEGDET